MLKNKKQIFKGMSYASMCLIVIGMLGTGYGVLTGPKYDKHLEQSLLQSKDTDGFVNFYHNKEQQLYELYKSGTISAKDYNVRLEALKTSEGLLGNKNEFMDETTIAQVDNLNKNAKTSRIIGNTGIFTTLTSWGLLSLFHQLADKCKYSSSKKGDGQEPSQEMQ